MIRQVSTDLEEYDEDEDGFPMVIAIWDPQDVPTLNLTLTVTILNFNLGSPKDPGKHGPVQQQSS